jgi:enamine deaminase RidA (YjgF/YER057c/UK114 family)
VTDLIDIAPVRGAMSPTICLGKAAPGLVSTCLTAPDRSQDVAGQTRQILDVIEAHLESVGSGRDRLLMVQIWLGDMADLAAVTAVWNAWIDPTAIPALSVVEAPAFRPDCHVEIRAYAAR